MPGCLMPWCHSAMIMSQRHNVTMPMIMMMGNNTRWWQWLPHNMMMTWDNTKWWQCPPCTIMMMGNNTRWRRTPLLMKYSNKNLKCHKLASQDPVKLVCASSKSSGQALVHYFCQNSTLSNLKKFNKNSGLNSVSILHPTTEKICFQPNCNAISSPAVILCPLITVSYRSRQCYQIM